MTTTPLCAATATVTADPSAELLRQAWIGVADMASERNITGLHAVVEARLAQLSNSADEAELLAAADRCLAAVAHVGATARTMDEIGRRLRRGIYECLLARDASSELSTLVAVRAPLAMSFKTVDGATLRATVNAQLAAGNHHAAALTVTRISRSQQGADIAEVACLVGRACRTAGRSDDAAACFQASILADADYEATGHRLATVAA